MCPTIALLVFEHLTTLDREIDFLWDHKFSWAKVIFLINRYIGLLYFVGSFVISLPGQSFSVSAHLKAVRRKAERAPLTYGTEVAPVLGVIATLLTLPDFAAAAKP